MADLTALATGLSDSLNSYLKGNIEQKRQQQNIQFQNQQAVQGQEQVAQFKQGMEGTITPESAGQLFSQISPEFGQAAQKAVSDFKMSKGRDMTIDEAKSELDPIMQSLAQQNNKKQADQDRKDKASEAALIGAQKGYNSGIKKEQEALDAVNTAGDQIKLAVNNPVAYSSVPITLARMMTGTSRINQIEIQKLGGSQAVLDRLNQMVTQMAKGTLTADNATYMENLAGVLKNSHQQNIEDLGVHHASQYRRVSGKSLSDAYIDITGSQIPDHYLKPVSEHPNLQPSQNDPLGILSK